MGNFAHKNYMHKRIEMSQTSINQRIKFLIKELKLSSRAFSAALDAPDATTRNYIDGRSKPGSDYLEKVLRTFESVNPAWLIIGEGAVFKDSTSESKALQQKNTGGVNIVTNHGVAAQHYNSIPDCEKDLQVAQDKIAQLTSQLQDKERIIQLLEIQMKK